MNITQSEMGPKVLLEQKAKNLPILTRTNNGAVRYCDKCRCLKPDRSHHCGVCQKCVLKMVNTFVTRNEYNTDLFIFPI